MGCKRSILGLIKLKTAAIYKSTVQRQWSLFIRSVNGHLSPTQFFAVTNKSAYEKCYELLKHINVACFVNIVVPEARGWFFIIIIMPKLFSQLVVKFIDDYSIDVKFINGFIVVIKFIDICSFCVINVKLSLLPGHMDVLIFSSKSFTFLLLQV